MPKKKLQFRLNDRLFAVEIEHDGSSSLSEDDIVAGHDAVGELIARNNEKESIIFYEQLLLVCSDCGISLSSDFELDDGRCAQCQQDWDRVNGGDYYG